MPSAGLAEGDYNSDGVVPQVDFEVFDPVDGDSTAFGTSSQHPQWYRRSRNSSLDRADVFDEDERRGSGGGVDAHCGCGCRRPQAVSVGTGSGGDYRRRGVG